MAENGDLWVQRPSWHGLDRRGKLEKPINTSPRTFWANDGDLYRRLRWHEQSQVARHPLFWKRENSSFNLETDSVDTVVDVVVTTALPDDGLGGDSPAADVAAESVIATVVSVVVVWVVWRDLSSAVTTAVFKFSMSWTSRC